MSGMSAPDEVLSATVEKKELHYSLQAHHPVPSKLGQKKHLLKQVCCRACMEGNHCLSVNEMAGIGSSFILEAQHHLILIHMKICQRFGPHL